MMKRTLFLLLCLCALSARAQVWGDLQVMYDYGHNFGTLTTEIGHTDKVGNSYGFVDFDFGNKESNGMYLEYGYNLRVKKNFFGRAEYDGGVFFNDVAARSKGTYAHGVLLGGAYQKMIKKTFLEFQLMYRMDVDYKEGGTGHGLQATGVWNTTFIRDKVYFGGYADFNYKGTLDKFEFGSEIQLLYCFRELGAGVEVELENWTGSVSAHPKMMLKVKF